MRTTIVVLSLNLLSSFTVDDTVQNPVRTGHVPQVAAGKIGPGYARRPVGVSIMDKTYQIHLLIFDAAPQPVDEDVVPPGALAIHADRNAVAGEHIRRLSYQGSLRRLLKQTF